MGSSQPDIKGCLSNYLSPPFKFKNFMGNPCLQHIPETAVSSKASNLPFESNSHPAWKSLQSFAKTEHKIQNKAMHNKGPGI
jgi:hypothetical protein